MSGRPTLYKKEFVAQAKKLSELGATDIEMADFFEVASSTFYKWKNEYAEFSEALKVGKEVADERVIKSLYHRAIGYTFESEKLFNNRGEIVRAQTREHVPPDTTACIFWLKNRRSQEWRDIQRHEHGEPGEFDQLADAQFYDALQQEAAELGVDLAGATDTQH